jgi:hypothetical protein
VSKACRQIGLGVAAEQHHARCFVEASTLGEERRGLGELSPELCGARLREDSRRPELPTEEPHDDVR